MLKKLMSLVISGLLVGSLMVGCSSSNTNNKNESSIPEYDEVAEEVGKTLLFQKQGEVYQQKLNEVKEKYPNVVEYMNK